MGTLESCNSMMYLPGCVHKNTTAWFAWNLLQHVLIIAVSHKSFKVSINLSFSTMDMHVCKLAVGFLALLSALCVAPVFFWTGASFSPELLMTAPNSASGGPTATFFLPHLLMARFTLKMPTKQIICYCTIMRQSFL